MTEEEEKTLETLRFINSVLQESTKPANQVIPALALIQSLQKQLEAKESNEKGN